MTQRRGLRAAKSVLAGAVPIALAVLCLGGPAHAQGAADSFSLKTPSGGIAVSGKVKASQIKLPVYPGAKNVTGTERGDLSFILTRKGKPGARLFVAKFETADSVARVRDFYKSELGDSVTRFTSDSSDGSVSFEMKADDQHGRYVQIKPAHGKTEIDLVRIDGMDLSDHGK